MRVPPILAAAAIAIALSVGAAACSGSDSSSATTTAASAPSTGAAEGSSTSASSSTTVPPSTVTTTAVTNQLAAQTLLDIPSFTLQSETDTNSGPSDLAKAAREDNSAGAQAELTADGYTGGYRRVWAGSSSDAIIAILYQFATPDGAKHYLDYSLAGLPANTQHFDVPEVPGGTGLATTASDSAAAAVVGVQGPYLYQVVADGPGTDGLDTFEARAGLVAQQLVGRLG
jgi:hypothetical protein